MVNPVFPVGPQKIKAQAIRILIYLVNKTLPQFGPLGRVDNTLKNGKLNPLTIILACLGNTA